MKLEFQDILNARKIIAPHIRSTELDLSHSISDLVGRKVYLKFENQQFTGSFKFRGALNKMASLTPDQKSRGVIASSAGNHAQGVALSARIYKIQSTIVMPVHAPLIKVEATVGYGAEVVLFGEVYDECFEHAQKIEKEKNLTFIHPYDDPLVMAGQGTIALEILEKISSLDSIVVPIGGGGLITGIAVAAKHLKPSIRIIGVQSNQACGMYQMAHHKRQLNQIEMPKKITTIADGIAIKKPSQRIYDQFICKYVDDIVTVNDDEISEAIFLLLERAKSVVEGSGAAGLAAVLNRKIDLGPETCVLLCGGNIDLNMMARIIDRGQIKKGRLAELSVVVDDLPGNLSRLTQILAQEKANILQVHHDRVSKGLFLRETQINFVLETRNQDHVQAICETLSKHVNKIL